jgi:hypothetical protein
VHSDITDPIAIGINVAEAYGKTAWGIASDAAHFLGEVVDESTGRDEAFWYAFSARQERGLSAHADQPLLRPP